MQMTLEEITAREGQLEDTIAECKRLLAGYQLIRAEEGKTPPVSREPAASAVLPPTPVPVLPGGNLEMLSKGYGGGIRLVTWAIRQLPGDFGVREIAAVLQQAGYPLRVRRLSVILNRMKGERKITEVWKGRGRTPSLFRATADVLAVPLALAARHRTPRALSYHIYR